MSHSKNNITLAVSGDLRAIQKHSRHRLEAEQQESVHSITSSHRAGEKSVSDVLEKPVVVGSSGG